MLLDHDRKLAFIMIPKVASTTIRATMSHCTEGNREDYFTVAFIRHPWDRLVSALYSVLKSEAPLDERLQRYWDQEIIDSHVRPQHTFLTPRVDFIGRLENFNADWEHLNRKFDLPRLRVSHVNKNRPKHWWDAKLDWCRWFPFYEKDFDLCPEWLH